MGKKHKSSAPRRWTAAGAARQAREARIATSRFLRDAEIAREMAAAKLLESYQTKQLHLRSQAPRQQAAEVAAGLLLTGLGYDPSWRPEHWMAAAKRVVADQHAALAEAELYVLSPQMCDVAIAAANTLTADDLDLITEDDLPSRTGILVLPQPLLVRAPGGNLGDDRAYQWQAPITMHVPSAGSWEQRPAVRIWQYNDTHGPVRPDSFQAQLDDARQRGTPLPPLVTDGMHCVPFEHTTTDEQRRSLAAYTDTAQRVTTQLRHYSNQVGFDEDQVVGEYTSGSEIADDDGTFATRFLYAFWRLCEQRITTTSEADIGHAARLAAERAGVPTDVRVVQLRHTTTDNTGETTGRNWQHRWVVRMHKVRQWYPSEQRHKVLYRGPYVKGPADKPLLDGETVRGLVR